MQLVYDDGKYLPMTSVGFFMLNYLSIYTDVGSGVVSVSYVISMMEDVFSSETLMNFNLDVVSTESRRIAGSE